MKASMYIYPWDIIDYEIEPCLHLLKSLGTNEFSVAVNYHTAKLLLPHNPRRKVYFTEPGLLYFSPDPEFYSGILRPCEASLTAGTDFLAELTEKAHSFDIDVIAWIVCMHNSRLGFQNPGITVMTATGDRLLHTLCPVNPHVRAYVKGLAADLDSRFNLKAIELESPGFMGFRHGYHHEIYGIELSPSLDFLLSLCFCPYCKEKASESGIDIEALHEAVRKNIMRELDAHFLPDSPWELQEKITGLEEFIEWRVGTITSFVGSVKRDSCKNRELITIATVFPPNADARLLYGADPAELVRVCDRVTVSGYFADAAELAKDLDILFSDGITPEKIRAGLRPQAPDSHNYENFREKLALLAKHSVSGVSFYNFGTMRASSFEWIRRGLKEVQG